MFAVEFLTWRASLYNSLSSPVFKLVLARRRTGSMMLQFQINAAAKLLRLRQPVPGTIAVSPDELTATFTPTAPLNPSTNYFMEATGGILDLEGQPLQFAFTSFTTGTQ